MRKLLLAALAVCALAGVVASADGAPAKASREYVVLYEHGASGKAARAAIADAGGRVVSENAAIGVATVRSSDSSFAGDVARSSAIVGATTNRVIGKAPRDAAIVKRDRVEKDLGQAAALVLLGTAFLMACAPSLVALLFQRGAFGPADTSATAAVIRVYSFGLPAQAMIGVMVRPYFCVRPVVRRADTPRAEGDRITWPDWYPVGAMLLGLAVTVAVGVGATPRFGALGLAAGNAAGITTTAALLMRGLMLRGVALRLPRVLGGQARLLGAALAAAALGWLAARTAGGPLPAALLGGTTVLLVFAALGALFGAAEVRGPVLGLLARARRPRPVPSTAAEGKPHHGR